MVLKCEDVSKSYKMRNHHFKLHIPEFTIEEGECVGLLGPNGSGKSTLLKLILNYIRYDTGIIELFGVPVKDKRSRMYIGYVPEEFNLFTDYTYGTLLKLMNGFYPNSNPNIENEINAICDELHIRDFLKYRISSLSKGMHQSYGIVRCLLNSSRFLIMDEPFSGLDPVQKELIYRALQKRKDMMNTSILLTSHIFEDITRLCDRVAIIKLGEIIEIMNYEEIVEQFGTIKDYYYTHFPVED